ncbi:cation:proton antiporter domain-containing protein [Fluviibacter phosphoraccumulans]|uniref:cation:proton antiporter domain-containing protein n=1 Tax=Fluviibacter phosphoraccumulans TaxID=1751046 RepID=UPI0032AEDC1C
MGSSITNQQRLPGANAPSITMSTLSLVLMLLAASVFGVILVRRINMPPMFGYLLVGLLIGPHALSLLKNVKAANTLAEFGVVFLMFSIGLEFSVARLFTMRKIVFGFGMAQVLVTMAVVTGLAMFAGLAWQPGLALGGAVAMSSTAVLSKLLVERRELQAPHGREVMGVLLAQDLIVVPLLIVIPALGQPAADMAMEVGMALLKATVVLGVVLFLGQKWMRRWFHIVARGKSSELFVLNVLLVTLGLAYVTEEAGLSLALGAFVAGMLISETEYRHQVEEDIKPFRDVLMGLFFVTIGMMLNPTVIWKQFWLVLLLIVGVLLVKAIIVYGLSRLFGGGQSTGLRSALWLAAGGEFGFVLLTEIATAKLAPRPIVQVVLAALLISMMLAPIIVHWCDRIVIRFSAGEWLARSMQLTQLAAASIATQKHAVLCGFGRSGQSLARILGQENISYVALDLDPERVREAAKGGESVMFGDAGRRENLIAAGVKRASVVVITFADTPTAEKVLHYCRDLRPDLPVLVRTEDERDLPRLVAAGAAEVVPDAQEASLMLGSHALLLMGVPLNRVMRRARDARNARYRLLRGFFKGLSDQPEETDAESARMYSVLIESGAFAIGQSLDDLALCDIEVSAIRRHGIRGLEPGPETRLQEGDVVVLLGTPNAAAAAEAKLLQGV